MLLDLDPRMKVVYELRKALLKDPKWVADSQALTLDKNKPLMGLKGTYGLFGSDEWWQNILLRKIQVEIRTGEIIETYFAGQDSRWGKQVNSFRLRCDDGALISEGIYVLEKADRKLFQVGARVSAAYALDELKNPQAALPGDNGRHRILIEMAVSRP